jgi:hypothetical protein
MYCGVIGQLWEGLPVKSGKSRKRTKVKREKYE